MSRPPGLSQGQMCCRFMSKLKQLQQDRHLCDLVFELRNGTFLAHKAVVSAWSPAIYNILREERSSTEVVRVQYDNVEVFTSFLSFLYSGQMDDVAQDNLIQLLHLATSLRVADLRQLCEEALKQQVHIANIISTYHVARKFRLPNLEEYALSYMQMNLPEAVKQADFLSLSPPRFNAFLSSGWVCVMKPEVKLFLIISWLGYDVKERQQYLVLLLRYIDWSVVANDFLNEISQTENFFTTNESSLYLLLQTLFSSMIPLGPYADLFPALRDKYAYLLDHIVQHSYVLPIEPEEYFPVIFQLMSPPSQSLDALSADDSDLSDKEGEEDRRGRGVEGQGVRYHGVSMVVTQPDLHDLSNDSVTAGIGLGIRKVSLTESGGPQGGEKTAEPAEAGNKVGKRLSRAAAARVCREQNLSLAPVLSQPGSSSLPKGDGKRKLRIRLRPSVHSEQNDGQPIPAESTQSPPVRRGRKRTAAEKGSDPTQESSPAKALLRAITKPGSASIDDSGEGEKTADSSPRKRGKKAEASCVKLNAQLRPRRQAASTYSVQDELEPRLRRTKAVLKQQGVVPEGTASESIGSLLRAHFNVTKQRSKGDGDGNLHGGDAAEGDSDNDDVDDGSKNIDPDHHDAAANPDIPTMKKNYQKVSGDRTSSSTTKSLPPPDTKRPPKKYTVLKRQTKKEANAQAADMPSDPPSEPKSASSRARKNQEKDLPLGPPSLTRTAHVKKEKDVHLGSAFVPKAASSKAAKKREEPEKEERQWGGGSEESGGGVKRWQCPTCDYSAQNQRRLDSHVRSVHGSRAMLFECSLCGFESQWNKQFYKHMQEHFPGPPFACDAEGCIWEGEKIQALLVHRRRHTDERPHKCLLCVARFRTRNNLIAHIKCHTEEKEHQCPVCHRRFRMKNTLEQHMVTHSDLRPYLCDTCGFSTKFQSHLISHKRIHTGEVFPCGFPMCTYSSPKRSQLKAHMRSHLNVRHHVCDICQKSFVEKSHLIRHVKIHQNDRPHKCDQCEYSSTRLDKVNEHKRKYHSEEASKSKRQYKYTPRGKKGEKKTSTSKPRPKPKAKPSKPEPLPSSITTVEVKSARPILPRKAEGTVTIASASSLATLVSAAEEVNLLLREKDGCAAATDTSPDSPKEEKVNLQTSENSGRIFLDVPYREAAAPGVKDASPVGSGPELAEPDRRDMAIADLERLHLLNHFRQLKVNPEGVLTAERSLLGDPRDRVGVGVEDPHSVLDLHVQTHLEEGDQPGKQTSQGGVSRASAALLQQLAMSASSSSSHFHGKGHSGLDLSPGALVLPQTASPDVEAASHILISAMQQHSAAFSAADSLASLSHSQGVSSQPLLVSPAGSALANQPHLLDSSAIHLPQQSFHHSTSSSLSSSSTVPAGQQQPLQDSEYNGLNAFISLL